MVGEVVAVAELAVGPAAEAMLVAGPGVPGAVAGVAELRGVAAIGVELASGADVGADPAGEAEPDLGVVGQHLVGRDLAADEGARAHRRVDPGGDAGDRL